MLVLQSGGIVRGGDAKDLRLRPLLMDVRPLDRALGVRSRSRTIAAGARAQIYRHENLLELAEPADKDGWRHEWWVDPARDYVIRRHLLVHQADTMIEQTISYFKDPSFGWLPCRWVTLRRKSHPGLWLSERAQLTAYRINGTAGSVPSPDDRAACH